VISKLHKS